MTGPGLIESVFYLILLLMFHKPKNGGRLDWYASFPRDRPMVSDRYD